MVILGSGILTPAHLTQQAIGKLSAADLVYALVPDPLGLNTIKQYNSKIINLADNYFDANDPSKGKNRLEAYNRMVDIVLKSVRAGNNVVCVFYGHPGIFVYPSHKMITLAKSENLEATMLPAISAEDCLYSDLGIDPGDSGCVSYEATQFIFYNHPSNLNATTILWQIGVVGDEYLNKLAPAKYGLKMLVDRLTQEYPEDHQVILYEASTLPIMKHRCDKLSIKELLDARVSTITTLVIPPSKTLVINKEFCAKWGVDIEQLK